MLRGVVGVSGKTQEAEGNYILGESVLAKIN